MRFSQLVAVSLIMCLIAVLNVEGVALIVHCLNQPEDTLVSLGVLLIVVLFTLNVGLFKLIHWIGVRHEK